MRYDSFPNSNKQPSDSLRAETPPVFITLKPCFAYCLAQWGPPGVCRHPSSFWSIILQCLGGDQSTILHMKGYILSFNMGYSSLPYPKNLQRYGPGEGPSESPLVVEFVSSHWSTNYILQNSCRIHGNAQGDQMEGELLEEVGHNPPCIRSMISSFQPSHSPFLKTFFTWEITKEPK